MRPLSLSQSLLAFLLLLALCLPAWAKHPRVLEARVGHVADGDTVTAYTANGTKLRIRLLGIDAPEVRHGGLPGQPYGEEAKQYLERLTLGKTIRVDIYGRDRHRRVLAVLWDGSVNINLHLVAKGYAEIYRGARCEAYCRELEEAEAAARRERLGMWAKGTAYESPGTYRHRYR